MHALMIEGPDNIGKTTAIEGLVKLYTDMGLEVQVIKFPERLDTPPELVSYYLGNSQASALERQYYILANSAMQYSKIGDVNIIIFDRHPLVSSEVYYDHTQDGEAGQMFRALCTSMTRRLGQIAGIITTTCIIFTGDKPFVDGDPGEHFEAKWHIINGKYNKLKYSDYLSKRNIECCAVDVHACGNQLLETVEGLFSHVRSHGSLPSPLSIAIPTPSSEGV